MVLQSKIYLSWVINSSLDKILQLSRNADTPLERIEYNIILITLLVMKFESQMNEITNSIKDWKTKNINLQIIEFIIQNERTLNTTQKYNLIAIELNMELWANNREPFQTLEFLVSLRNEVIHYKGGYISKGKGPNNKITSLLKNLNTSSIALKAHEPNHWVTDLIGSEKLINWLDSANSKIDQIHNKILEKIKNIT